MPRNGKKLATVAPRMMKDSAQAVWLAGLGALATAGDEGNKIFHQLVKRGEQVDKVQRGQLKKLVARADDLRGDATSAFETRLRKPLDKGMATALHRLGVPTRSEILELTKRVEALTRAVEKQQKKTHAPKAVHHAAAG
jgi:poly(hydroxyalkanoate) granule-associated protein